MTDIIHLVEEMRAKISRITHAEEELVWTLRDTLSRVDEKLLLDVRAITTEHENLRGHSLRELQRLSSRLGTFPTDRAGVSRVEDANPHPTPIAAAQSSMVTNHIRRRDCRQATSNIEDEPERCFEVMAVASR